MKFIKKLIYPGFVCVFTFISLIFFTVTLLPKIQSMFAIERSETIFTVFNMVVFVQVIIYMCLAIGLLSPVFSKINPI
ncbi:MAG: hypothetical protein KMY54_10350, partial [Erysipelothrix sp.]|nr:hypothetical protein [Erysipelothrix sp.]